MIDDSASGMAYNRFANLDGIEDRVIQYLLSYDNKTAEEKRLVTRIRRILLYNDIKALLTYEEGGYPDPDSRQPEDINIIDEDADDYYCGLALVPKNSGLTAYPGTTEVDIEAEDESEGEYEPTSSVYIWTLADNAIGNLIYNDNGNQSTKRIFRTPRLSEAFTEQCSMIKVYVDSIIPTDHLKAVVNIGIDIVVGTDIINVSVSETEKNTYIYETKRIDDSSKTIIVPVQTKSRVTTLTQAVLALLNGAAVQGVGKINFSRNLSIYNKAQYGLWNNRSFEGMKLVMGVYMSGVS